MIPLDSAVRALEIAVLATTLVGNMFAAYALSDYIGDLIVLDGDKAEHLTAHIGIRTSAMLALVFLLFLTYAIYALLGPLPAPGREVRSLVGMSIIEAVALALMTMKIFNVRDRWYLLRYRRSKP